MNEDMILYGGEVKAAGNGKVEGYLVLFGDMRTPDRSAYKDFFTPETDYGLDVSNRTGVYYHHGFSTKIKDRRLGIGECKTDDTGIWIDAALDLKDEADAEIYTKAERGELGWSSGAVTHLVRRERQDNGTHRVLKWPIGEASMTPNPADPRTFVSVKSLLGEDPDNLKFDIKTLDDIASERDYEKLLRPLVGQEAAIALTAIAKHNFKSQSLRNREEEEARQAKAEEQAREERIRRMHQRQRALSLRAREAGLLP